MSLSTSLRGFARQLWRDSRGSRRQLAFFVACLAVGVAAVVAVAGFSEGLERGIRKQARQLLAADLAVSAQQPPPEALLGAIDHLPGARRTSIIEMLTLVAVPEGLRPELADTPNSLLVELKSLDGPYPFYGDLEVEPATDLQSLLDGERVVVAPQLLTRLGLQVGDKLQVGDETFLIAGVVRKEPDRIAGAFNMGPRVFIDQRGLDRSGLVKLGSRVSYRTLVALEDGDEQTVAAAKEALQAVVGDDIRQRIETYREAQPALRQGLKRSERYLALAALLSLLVGGVGVAQTVRAWVAGRLDTIAVLKCLGYRPRQILALHLGQCTVLALVGSLVGATLGVALQLVAARLLVGILPVEYLDPWQPMALLQGLALGVGVALLFSWPPLAAARRVPPIRVLRRDAEPIPPSGWARWGSALILVGGVFGLAAWQSRSLRDGALFVVGLLVVTGLLALAARLLSRLASRARPTGRPWLRHGLAALGRVGGGSTSAIVALGLGVLVVLTMTLVERRLTAQLDQDMPVDAPSVFFIDIQPDQWPELSQLFDEQGAEQVESVPVVMARLQAVDGKSSDVLVEELAAQGRDARWALRREQRLTYLEQLPEDNEIVAGSLWSDPQKAEVSVEEDYAKLLGIDVGSTLLFDIQGVDMEMTVGTVRTVDWGTFGINFYLVVEPGVLEEAPQQRIAAVRQPRGQEQALQDLVSRRFPNVTAIQIREVLEKISGVFEQLGLGVRLLGILTVAGGLAILAGAVSASAAHRGREVALLKTLGMTRRQVVATFATEYALVGLVSGLIGTVGATVLAYFVATRGMDVVWQMEWMVLLVALLGTVVLSVVAGLAASRRALGQRPVEVLRAVGE